MTSNPFQVGETQALNPYWPASALAFLIWLAASFAAFSPASAADTSDATQGFRGELESQFRAATGLGFSAFDCAFPQGWPNSREILCDATDEEGDTFLYRLLRVEGQGAPRIIMKQPVGQLNPEGLATLRKPTDAFLAAFIDRDWPAVLASVSPSFESQLGLEDLQALLAPMRDRLDSVGKPQASHYASPSEGLHQLEYSLESSPGEAVGRFRLRFDAQGDPQIVSFLITAKPGSPLYIDLLQDTGKAVLNQFFDQPILRIDGPLHQLLYLGDHVEITLVLADDSRAKARIEQHASAYDLDTDDFRFQVLDASTLIRLHLASQGQTASSIDCPQTVVPDGGTLDCRVTVEDGLTSTARLMRQGGDHRLRIPRAPD